MRRTDQLLLEASLLWLLAGCGTNGAPTAPEIDVEPVMPHTGDDLRLIITSPSVDPDGDQLLYHTRWFQDGEIRPDVHGDVVPSERTVAGEYWIAELWATDGVFESPVAASTAYVFNSAPEATVRLRPGEPDTRSDLEAHARASDLDGHDVSYDYSWTVDGVATDHQVDTIPSSDTAKGQVWAVEVVPYDGDSWGMGVSAQVSVGNAAPDTPVVGILPTQPLARQDALQCLLLEPVGEPDGDPLDYRIEWSVDGEAFDAATDNELPGDTVPAEHTNPHERWECVIWADDGDAESRPGRASVVIDR